MTLTIKIEMDNAAFDGGAHDEAARILRALAKKIEAGAWNTAIMDVNGNKVGKCKVDR